MHSHLIFPILNYILLKVALYPRVFQYHFQNDANIPYFGSLKYLAAFIFSIHYPSNFLKQRNINTKTTEYIMQILTSSDSKISLYVAIFKSAKWFPYLIINQFFNVLGLVCDRFITSVLFRNRFVILTLNPQTKGPDHDN